MDPCDVQKMLKEVHSFSTCKGTETILRKTGWSDETDEWVILEVLSKSCTAKTIRLFLETMEEVETCKRFENFRHFVPNEKKKLTHLRLSITSDKGVKKFPDKSILNRNFRRLKLQNLICVMKTLSLVLEAFF